MRCQLGVVFAILLFVLSPSHAYKEWNIHHFGIEEGLSFEIVRDIALSKDRSTVWIATWGGGVCGFEKGKWTYLRAEDGLSSDSIRTIFPVEGNGLWIGGIDGVSFYDSHGIQLFTRKNTPGLPDDNVFIINDMGDGNLWLGTADGYVLATSSTYQLPGDRNWRVVMDPGISGGGSIRQIFVDQDGHIRVLSRTLGLFRLDGSEWKIEASSESVGNHSLRGACQAADGSLWIGGTPNLARTDGTGWQVFAEYNNIANWICPTPESGVWVGDDKGVGLFRDGEWKRLPFDSQEPDQFVEIIRYLPDESIWVGTRNGAYRVVPSCWRLHKTTADGKKITPNILIAEPDLPPLAVDEDNRFITYENRQWIPKGSLPEQPDYRGLLTQIRAGKFWIAGASHLYQITRDTLQIEGSIPIPENVLLRGINLSPEGVLWALAKEGVFRYSGEAWVPEPSDTKYVRAPAYCMEFSDDGSLWFGLQDRIEQWKDGKVIEHDLGQELDPNMSTPLRSIKQLSDHSLWMCSTPKGIAIYNGVNWDTLGVDEGLSSHLASYVYKALDGSMLVGYRTNGISQRHSPGYWSTFRSQDGIPAGQVSFIGESPEGRFWARIDVTGIVSYDPKTAPPQTLLKSFQGELNPGEDAEYSFTGFDLDYRTAPNEMVYSWRFVQRADVDQDSGWSPFQRLTQVKAPQLSPGEYFFQVRSGDKEGEIDPEPASVLVHVLPPVWRRAEVLIPGILLIVVGLLLGWLLIRKHRALEQSERRFRTLVEGVPSIPIQGFDKNRQAIFWNSASERLYGYQKEEVLGKQIETLFYDPEIRGQVPSMITDALKSGSPPPAGEVTVLKKDGEPVHVYSCFVIMKNTDGENELFCIDVDLTDRKRAEEERKHLDSLVQYSQKLESLGVLAGGIAHDFNNLLLGILGNAELALHELANSSPLRAYLNSICKAADRAADLTRQMLAFSGKGKFLVVNLNLNKVVESTLQLMGNTLPDNISIQTGLTEDLPLIHGDSSQMQQVVMNLVQNAIESISHSKPGNIIVCTGTGEYTARELSLSRLPDFPPPGRFVFLEVIDNGSGMNAEVEQKLFDPFFTTKFLGRGLGLPAVLGIIRGHHGAIFISSEVEKGSSIRLLFPVVKETQEAPKEAKACPAPKHRAANPCILVVDDDESVREVARRMIEKMQFEVLLASDGIEAVETVRAQPDGFDCVLLDLSMPRMNGIQTMEIIQQINPNLPIILSSGFSEAEIRQQWSGSEGMSAFIQKPYLSSVLREKLLEILALSEPA